MFPLRSALFALLLLPALSAAADRVIRVTGVGKASAPPDMANVQAGVVSQAPTAAEALAANSKAMKEVFAAIKGNGVAAKDMQTSSLNVRPVYKRDNRGQTSEIIAYEVSNQVQVKVRDLKKLGVVLDAVVKSGANQVSGVSLTIADGANLRDHARRDAYDDAKRRAELYAERAGVRLGKVLTISEEPIREPRPVYFGARMAVADSAEVPIATGEEEVQARVHVEFAIEDGSGK